MKQIVIVGGGFGGISAARYLCAHRERAAIILIDRKSTSEFLPLLPDVVGGRLTAADVSTSLDALAYRQGFVFILDTVQRIDPDRRCVIGAEREYPYDALIMAAGSEPNYYGDLAAQQAASPLNTTHDAEYLAQKLKEGNFETCVIIGGGYTGIEVATHVWRRLRNAQTSKAIVIVEAASSLLGAQPEWMKEYALKNLNELNIGHVENCRLTGVEDSRVSLSNGRLFESALLVWSAGVQTPACVRALPFAQAPQGRVQVDEYLRVREDLFVVGDSAAVMKGNLPLRMSVQFAIGQGACAAANVLRFFRGARPRTYRPMDPGFVIPMANGRSCGAVFGARLRGKLPTLLHYGMCAYRLPEFAQKMKMFKMI